MNITFLGTGKIVQLVNDLCKHRDLTEFNSKYSCEKATLIWYTLVISVLGRGIWLDHLGFLYKLALQKLETRPLS